MLNTHPMFGPAEGDERRHHTQIGTHTSQQSNSSNTTTQLYIIRNEITLDALQRRMPQLLEINPRLVAFYELGTARRLSKRSRRLRKTEKTVKLGQHADSTQPDAPILVEFGEDTRFV